ncbi:MAG TPA: SDR family oxidoreductase [Anaerolineales bacterium]|nr:SDR family oxidoreductase [Anaerolineales bacterium]
MNDLTGKTILITGATNGIGKAAAMVLAKRGATLVIVGRNPEKTIQVVQQIKASTGNPAVDGLISNLSSMSQVRRLAREFRQKYAHLHLLINNAGGIYANRTTSVDGYEYTFALNHLAYFLLTNLLLDMLITDAPSRIINVSSRAHEGATLNFDDLQNEQHYAYGGYRAYGQSKLDNLLFTYELARRLSGTGVTANAIHPGVVATGFGKNNHGAMKVGMRVYHQFALTPEQGADTIIYLASSPAVECITGKYWVNRQQVASSPESYDEATQKHLWSVSAQLTGIHEPMHA